jgi:hypothetical protein
LAAIGAGGPRREDPTKNVRSALKHAVKRIDDLRIQDLRFQERLYDDRARSEAAAREAESRRIDALLKANTDNVALALEKQGAQAQAQDRRIAVLEQNQYQAGGKDIQRVESRQSSQFTLSQIVAGAGVLVLVLIELRRSGVI